MAAIIIIRLVTADKILAISNDEFYLAFKLDAPISLKLAKKSKLNNTKYTINNARSLIFSVESNLRFLSPLNLLISLM